MAGLFADAGYETVEFEQLTEWAPGRGGVVVVAAIPPDDTSLLSFTDDYPHIPCVVVVPELDSGAFAAAVRAGASGAVDEADPAESFVASVEAARTERILAPRRIAAAMAARMPALPDAHAWMTDDEAGWLQTLAGGATVADLAERIGYSERETFRMLGALYRKIGVRNRTEAIIWATRHGLLDLTTG